MLKPVLSSMQVLLILMVILPTAVMSIMFRNLHLLFADTMHREDITDHLADISTRLITTIRNMGMTITDTVTITEAIMEMETGMVITEIEIIRIIINHKKRPITIGLFL